MNASFHRLCFFIAIILILALLFPMSIYYIDICFSFIVGFFIATVLFAGIIGVMFFNSGTKSVRIVYYKYGYKDGYRDGKLGMKYNDKALQEWEDHYK